jgi:hypothetical protein
MKFHYQSDKYPAQNKVKIRKTMEIEQELPECSHRMTRSHFVMQAKNDDISNIKYNVNFLMNDTWAKNYLGINTITFDYGGNGCPKT